MNQSNGCLYAAQDWTAKEIEGVLNSYGEKFKTNTTALEQLNSWDSYIDRTRLARNTILHRAIVSESEVGNICSDGIEFIKSLMKTVFKLDYDELTYSALLRREKFKQLAKDAETSLQKGNYDECIEISNYLVSEVVGELSSVAREAAGAFMERIKVMDERYAEGFQQAETRTLAKDLKDVWINLGLATTLTQFFTYEEKVNFIKLNRLSERLQKGKATMEERSRLAFFSLDFATNFAYKAEGILRSYEA